jgi:hypothetical protein
MTLWDYAVNGMMEGFFCTATSLVWEVNEHQDQCCVQKCTERNFKTYLPHYIIRKYVLPIWLEHNYIFLQRIVHWVYNYMFRPCILVIVSLYCKHNKQLYNMCMRYFWRNEISSTSVSGRHGFGPVWTGVNVIYQCIIILLPFPVAARSEA